MEDSKYVTSRNTVRARGAPFARPRAALSREGLMNRESNALRASVLDVAMQVGLGANGAVTDWIYNNSVNEEDEEEPISSPGQKYSSSAASFAASEDWSSTSSARFPYSPPSSSRSVASSTRSLFSAQRLFSPGALAIPEEPSLADDEAETASNFTSIVPSISFPDLSTMHLPSVRIPAKLKKRRGDGYESDAGYVSDVRGKKKDGGSNARGEKAGENSGADKKDEKAHAKEEKKKKDAERQRASSFTSRGTGKDAKTNEGLTSKGYETDAPPRRSRFGRKKKSGASDVGYDTDAGYISSPSPGPKKSKSKFFRLGGRSSKPDLTEAASKNVPPLAQKFGTTQLPALPPLPSLDASFASTLSTSTSLAETPPLSTPAPAISTTPVPPQTKSEELKKDLASEKRVRDSHVSGESSRSSTSNASSGHLREARTAMHKSFRFLSGPKSSANPSSNKFPVISLPLGRTVSPPPSDANVNSIHQTQDHPEPLSTDLLRSPSPSPSKSGSVVQESRGEYTSHSSAPLSISSQQGPALLSPTSPPIAISASSAPSSPVMRRTSLRPRYSQLTVVTASNLTTPSPALLSRGSRSLSPNPSSERVAPSHLAIPPSSVSNGTLLVPNSNILSYYDIPPPSPPPNAPLPKVPDTPQSDVEDDPFGINSASVIRSLSRTDRGKDVPPFLSRLRVRADSFNSATKSNGGAKIAAKTTKQQNLDPRLVVSGVAQRRRSDSSKVQEADNDDVDSQDMQDVLDHFVVGTSNHRGEREAGGTALGRSRSPEALHNGASSHTEPTSEARRGDLDEAESFYGQEGSRRRRSTLYYSDLEEDGTDPRLSRWSGSIYSRGSFMDSQKSEETRTRFVKRVEAMLDEAGIERGNKRNWGEVPPVPKLPEELARSNILTRQKNQMKNNVRPVDNSWIQF